jgi:hypothetical protein
MTLTIYSLALQENGVAKAVESIYRDLEYARSIIKFSQERHEHEDTDVEWETAHKSGTEGAGHALSEDWSIVDEGNGDHGKEGSRSLISPKRISVSLGGLIPALHSSRSRDRSPP